MGWIANFANRVRAALAQSPEAKTAELARGYQTGPSLMGVDSVYANFAGSQGSMVELEQDLQRRYIDYENMDDYPELSVALDLYADDICQPDYTRDMAIWVSTPDQWLKATLTDLYHGRLGIEDDLWPNVRTLCKYGSAFGEILVNKDGVVGINYLPTPSMRRVVTDYGETKGFLQDPRMMFSYGSEEVQNLLQNRPVAGQRPEKPGGVVAFEPWEVIHWRLRMKHHRSIYGYPPIEPGRWTYRRLAIMEDSALIHRLSRAPDRLAFMVDVGNLSGSEALAYVEKIRNRYRKKKFYNQQKGGLDLKHNPLCFAGDTKIPLLDGTERSLIEMAEAYQKGEEQWVYSADREHGGGFVPGKVVWAGKTRERAQLVKITLDNGECLRPTPDHKFIRRNGEYVEAKDLVPGDSLLPLHRIISSRDKGYTLDGYEMVFDPAQSKHVYTHRIVARACGIYEHGKIIHHAKGKLNNDPRYLQSLTRDEHSALHEEVSRRNGQMMAERRRRDPQLAEKMSRLAAENLARWRQSETGRVWYSQMAERNRMRDSARPFREYNASALHTEHNALRSAGMKNYWTDENRAAYSQRRTIVFSDEFLASLASIVSANPRLLVDQLCEKLAQNDEAMARLNAGSCRKIVKVHRHLLLRAVRSAGHENLDAFRSAVLGNNHKVVAIELDGIEDTYTISVEYWHNFATSAGVFVKNSMADDFWIPSKGGKDSTRIESINGSSYQSMEDVQYFLNKLRGSIKIPASYIGGGDQEPAGRELSHSDVKFARTVMRIQRTTRQGYRQAGHVHLAAIGKNPWDYSAKWDLQMTIPSYIFELAVVEAMAAKAQLAQQLGEVVGLEWVLTNVFKFTEAETKEVLNAKRKELATNIESQAHAEGQADKIRAQYQPQPEGEPGTLPARKPLRGGQKFTPAVAGAAPTSQAEQPSPAMSPEDVQLIAVQMARIVESDKHWRTLMADSGNVASERRLEKKLDELARTNHTFFKRLDRVMPMMEDLQETLRQR